MQSAEADIRLELRVLQAYDASHRLNWGARGASAALTDILRSRFSHVDTLPGTLQEGQIPLAALSLPGPITSLVVNHRRVRRALSVGRRVISSSLGLLRPKSGAPVPRASDPRAIMDTILRHRDSKYVCGLICAIQGADVIVIDGDGDVIFTQVPGSCLLFDLALIHLARHFGKPVFFVNSIVSDCPLTGRNQSLVAHCITALTECDGVALRDPHSMKILQEIAPHINPVFVPDSLFHWYDKINSIKHCMPDRGVDFMPLTERDVANSDGVDFAVPYICVSGSSGAARVKGLAVPQYCTLVARLKDLKLRVYLVPTCSGDDFLYDVAARTSTPVIPGAISAAMGGAILARAHLFVSGRYHPSILASLGGTPCLFLGADSHKTLSLQEVLGYEEPEQFSAIPTARECDTIYARAKDTLSTADSLRSRIQRVARQRATESRRFLDMIAAGVIYDIPRPDCKKQQPGNAEAATRRIK